MGDEQGKKLPSAKPVAGKPVAAKPVKPGAGAAPASAAPAPGKTVAAKPAGNLPTAKPVTAAAKPLPAKPVAARPLSQAVAAAPVAPAPRVTDVEEAGPVERPASVTFFGALNLLFGMALTCLSTLSLLGVSILPEAAAGPTATGFAASWEMVAAVLGVVSGIVCFTTGIGLLTLQKWGRLLAVWWSLIYSIVALLTSTINLLLVLRPASADGGVETLAVVAHFAMLVIGVGYPIALLFCMMRLNVRAAFLGLTVEQMGAQPESMRDWLKSTPGWVSSAVVHASILLMLGLLTLEEKIKEVVPDLTALSNNSTSEVEEMTPVESDQPEAEDIETETVESVDPAGEMSDEVVPATSIADAIGDPGPAPELDEGISPITVPVEGLGTTPGIGAGTGNGLGGRTGKGRQGLVASGGGSAQSEEGVARGLKWIAAHQNPDGSWSFEHNKGACQGRCGNNGKVTNGSNGATALALLPFLGSGETHKEGKYAKTVQAGLAYLVNSMKVDANGGSLMDGGNMYSHGLASICLCEAYAMTQDRNLFNPAQQVVNFIVYAQDKVGGGWRYSPGMPGDTSVVGWQLMALKSAHMGYLTVPPNVIKGAENFLNTVQVDTGAGYGYTGPGPGQATTAIGLLCRMYLGWKKDNDALQRGIDRLSKAGPSKTNMYYNYYATQVMHHVGGEHWKQWNAVMRDYLVDTQERDGHLEGSWYLPDQWAEAGGRLYCTALCTMTLEVYYRYMPLYSETAGAGEFDENEPQGEDEAEEPPK